MGEKKNYKIFNTLIDAAGFYAGNFVVAQPIHIAKPEMHHLLIFAIVDALVRNKWILKNKNLQQRIMDFDLEAGNERLMEDEYIAVIYFLSAAVFDSLVDKDGFKAGILANAVRAGVGLGTNYLIDQFLFTDEYH